MKEVASSSVWGPYPNYDDIARFEYGRRLWRLPEMRARFLRHWTDERHPYRHRFLEQRELIEEVLTSEESPEELECRLSARGTSLRCVTRDPSCIRFIFLTARRSGSKTARLP